MGLGHSAVIVSSVGVYQARDSWARPLHDCGLPSMRLRPITPMRRWLQTARVRLAVVKEITVDR